MSGDVLSLYRRMRRWPAGRWLFSRAVCHRAPYFATIAPLVTVLEPGRCEVRMQDRRRLRNHIGGVHAIAMCNLAELAAGLMTDATIGAGLRWIPKGMAVEYQGRANGPLLAVATPEADTPALAGGQEWPVAVAVSDRSGQQVFHARVVMWVTPAKKPGRSR